MPLSSVLQQFSAWRPWSALMRRSAWRRWSASAEWSALPAPLCERLWAVVQRQRRLALAQAAGETLVLAAGLLIALMVIDAGLHPLPEARRMLWWFGVGLSAAFFSWRAFRPLLARAVPASAAALIDQLDAGRDELIGAAVQFACLPPTPGNSAWMVHRTMALASQRADACQPRRVISSLRARRALLLAAGLVAALAVLAATPRPRPWLMRALSPWTAAVRPSAVSIAVAPGDQVLAQGAAVVIAADVATDPGAATLRLVWADGSRELLPMTRVEVGRYRQQLAAVPLDGTYQVLSGDAESAEFSLRTIAHPQVRKLSLRILPPAYTGLAARMVEGGDAEVLSGSRVQLAGELAGEPVLAAALVAAAPGPEHSSGTDRQFALTLDDSRPQHFRLDLQPTASLAYGLRFTGASGQVAEPPQRWQLSVIADRPPSIDATALVADAGASGNAINRNAADGAMALLVDLHQRFVVRVQAADDVALREVTLEIAGARGQRRTPVALPRAGATAMDAQVTLTIDDYAAMPGDELSVSAEAIDSGGQRTTAPMLRFTVADAAGSAAATCSARWQMLQRRWTAVVAGWPALARGWQEVARNLRPGDPAQADAARLLSARLDAWHREVQTLADGFGRAAAAAAAAASTASDTSPGAAALGSWSSALNAWSTSVSAWDAARREQDAAALLVAANPAATAAQITAVRAVAAIAADSTAELTAWTAPIAPAAAWMQAQELLARARALRLRVAQVAAAARGTLAWAGDPAVGADIDAAMVRLSDEGDPVAQLAELAARAAQLPGLARACALTLGVAVPPPNPEPAAMIAPPTIALMDRWQRDATAQCAAFLNALSAWPVPRPAAWPEDALAQLAPRLMPMLRSHPAQDAQAAQDTQAAEGARVAAMTRGWAAWAQTHASCSGAAALAKAAAPDASLAERAAWLAAARALLSQAGMPPAELSLLSGTTLADEAALSAAQTAVNSVAAWATVAAQVKAVALHTRAAAAARVAQVHERAAVAALRAGRVLEAARQSDLAAADSARVGVPRAEWAGLLAQASVSATVVLSTLHRAIAADFTANPGSPALAQQAALVLGMVAETQGDDGRLALAGELRRSPAPRSAAENAALGVRFAATLTQPDSDDRRRRLTAWRRLADGGREELARQLATVAGVRVPAAERQQAAERLAAAMLAQLQAAPPTEGAELAARLRALVAVDAPRRLDAVAPRRMEAATSLPAWLVPEVLALAERATHGATAEVLPAWWAIGRRLADAELLPLMRRARANDAATPIARRDGLFVAQWRAQLLRALDDGARTLMAAQPSALSTASALATAAAATGDQRVDQTLADRVTTLAIAMPAALAAADAAQAAQAQLRLVQAAARAAAVGDVAVAEAAVTAAMQLETNRAELALATVQALLVDHPGPLAVARALPAALSLADTTRALIAATDPVTPVLIERLAAALSASTRARALLPAAGDAVLEELGRVAVAEQALPAAIGIASDPAAERALAQAALALLNDPSDADAGSAVIALIDRAAALPVGATLAAAPAPAGSGSGSGSGAGGTPTSAPGPAGGPLLPESFGDSAARAEVTQAPWLRADGGVPSLGTPHLEAFPPDSQAAIRAYRRRLGAER